MSEFNSDDHYIYYCGQESLRRNGAVAIMVNKSPKCNTWMQSQRRQNDLCFQGKPSNTTVIQVYAPTTNAKEAEVEWLYEDLQDLLELTPNKDCFFHYRGLECKSRKSRATWINRQVWPCEAGQRLNRVLQRERTVHSKHPLPTTQDKTLHMDITR